MSTQVKIKIYDDAGARELLDAEYERSSQIELCRYALLLADHILELVKFKDIENPVIKNGFFVNEKWQAGNARMHEVRQAGFKIHEMAKARGNALDKTALRVVGQAVATGHMREHAMVASDYAVKAVNLMYSNDMDSVQRERKWQLDCLRAVKNVIYKNKQKN